MRTITTAIIDYDLSFIDSLKTAIKNFCAGVNITGIAENFNSGMELLDRDRPQLLFLGTRLKDSTGFKLLDECKKQGKALPYVIFLSDDHKDAIKAIKYKPIDYILKPDSIELLPEAVKSDCEEVEKELTLHEQETEERIKRGKKLNFIAIPNSKQVQFIKTEDILFLESEGRYTSFYLKDQKHKLMSVKNIGEYEKLVNDTFFRIHKSYIVNLQHVLSIDRSAGYYCTLENGKMLPIAKRRLTSLEAYINLK
jgi:two-component system LytT family response regulator